MTGIWIDVNLDKEVVVVVNGQIVRVPLSPWKAEEKV